MLCGRDRVQADGQSSSWTSTLIDVVPRRGSRASRPRFRSTRTFHLRERHHRSTEVCSRGSSYFVRALCARSYQSFQIHRNHKNGNNNKWQRQSSRKKPRVRSSRFRPDLCSLLNPLEGHGPTQNIRGMAPAFRRPLRSNLAPDAASVQVVAATQKERTGADFFSVRYSRAPWCVYRPARLRGQGGACPPGLRFVLECSSFAAHL
jgi:hypothetical protein